MLTVLIYYPLYVVTYGDLIWWYDMIWYDMIRYNTIRYMIYDMRYMIWHDIWHIYDIWYDMIWYDMICLLTAVGLTPCGGSTIYIYTKSIIRTAIMAKLSRIWTQGYYCYLCSVLYILFSSCQLALFGYPDWGFSVLFPHL